MTFPVPRVSRVSPAETEPRVPRKGCRNRRRSAIHADAGGRREPGACGIHLEILDHAEHVVGEGADACAVACVKVRSGDIGPLQGVGRHGNIVMASLHAVTSAINRIRLAERGIRTLEVQPVSLPRHL